MKHIKLFEEYSLVNEKKEPRDEVDHKALRKYVTGDKSVRDSLIKSKGKKVALGDFINFEKPTPAEMENLAAALKELEIGIYDESWANIIEHPNMILDIEKYFVGKGFITNDELKKMPDFQSTLKNNIKMDPETWNQEVYNKIGSERKIDGIKLGSSIGYLSN
jgi:hypothetical protein